MNRNPQNGFNLIELVIVVSLIGILAALAMPTFSTFTANSRIRTAAEGMLNGLQIARAEAVRRNTYVSLQFGADKISWNVVAPDGTTIQTRGAEPATIVMAVATSTDSAGVNVTNSANTTGVTFAGMGRMVAVLDSAGNAAAPLPSVLAIRYSSTVGTTRAMCVVVASNTPRLCDPQRPLDLADPQSCTFNNTLAPVPGC